MEKQKTYRRHYYLAKDIMEIIGIETPVEILFGQDKWTMYGVEFEPILYNKRMEKTLDGDDYRFEASAKENANLISRLLIKEKVKQLGLTQKEIAEKIGYSESHFKKFLGNGWKGDCSKVINAFNRVFK